MVSNTDGQPLDGASVKVKGSATKGTTTDITGKAILKGIITTVVLEISYTGYVTQEIKLYGRTDFIMVKLQQSTSQLDEIQIIAYGTTTKRYNTGDVTTIKAEDIAKQPVTNPLAALEGMVPGLVITQQSGVPGGNFNVQLRGQNSLYGGNPASSIINGQPLYVIDGVPYAPQALGQVAGDAMYLSFNKQFQLLGNSSEAGPWGLSPLNNIDPSNIESIDVLKDADATAIYGSRGSNGVILITTKKGKVGATSVSAGIRHGITAPTRLPDYMNTGQYLAMRHQVFKNDGTTPGTNDYDLNGTWDTTRNINWGKELIKPSNMTNAQLSISGGNTQTQFLIGASYNIMSPPYDGNFSDKNTSVNFNINNVSLNSKFRVMLSGSYSVDDNTLPGMNTIGNLNLPPMYPSFHKADGSLNWWGSSAINPYAQLLNSYHANTKAIISNATISYQLLPGLQLKSSFGYTNNQFTETRLNPLAAKNPLAYNNISTALFGSNSRDSWIIEPGAEYKHQLYKGILDVMVGATVQSNVNEGSTTTAYNFITDAAMNNITAAAQTLLSNSYSKYHYAAVFGRINYILQNKYILNLTGRRDGSSRFAPAKRTANFSAAGAAWLFSEEGFIKNNLPFLSYGKLRGSYGLTGNDGIGDYSYLDTYTISGNQYYGQPELYPTRLFSTNFSWESNKKLEGGLDLGFLKDRILVTASWYRNRCSNQLIQTTLPTTSGNTTVQANFPALIQNTGWEFELNTKNIESKGFSWTSAFNISTSRNKLVAFPGLATSSYASTYVVGQPLTIMKLYHLADVNPKTGYYEFKKADGTIANSSLTTADQTVIQNMNPKFYGMLNNSFKYKGWQLSVVLNFMKQTGKNLLFTNQAPPFTSPINMPTFFLNQVSHWQKTGDISKLQKYSDDYTAQTAYSYASQSDLAYSDASFIRCKNVSLSYQFNSQWIKHLHLNGANVYFSAQNLFTITHYMGYDPETQGTILPPSRTVTVGIQITL
jgi:TonB-linked SusC/RagA family outer membrane protein